MARVSGVLYLRNVPDDVVDGLSALAARESMSVSAFAVRELREIARRADNRALLGSLADRRIAVDDIVSAVGEGRSER